ncbi:MAG TPA: hypothetical protein VGX68_23835 [Thermoanaerobaculia bacterium]|jgi:hypothetical protein|nr:hypothetical protein [Thermoanaerobaculia bacterium]
MYRAWFSAVPLALLLAIPAAAQPDATGTWTGTLPLDGADRPVVVQLHQRADGSLLGYVLGGGALVVAEGSAAGGRVRLRMEREDPAGTLVLQIDALQRGARLRGSADDGSGARAISWRRTPGDVCERRLAVAPAATEALHELAVATDCRGHFLAGGFTARDACGPLGCAGAVTSFEESGGRLAINLATGGACPTTPKLRVTFDSTARAYRGTYTVRDCRGAMTSGSVLAARWTQTRNFDVKGIFAALGRLADDLERGAAIPASYLPVSPSYLHFGRTAADLLADLRAEIARYTAIDVAFGGFQGFRTVADPDTFPELAGLPGVDFHDRRRGTPRAGGAAVIYRDTETDLIHSELKYVRAEAGVWKIVGNQSAPFDLPFRWEEGAESLEVATPAGPVYVSVGPFGSHFSPLTGHAYGDAKANFAGFFSKTANDLAEVPGDGAGDDDGTCEPGEDCGYPTAAAAIRDRTPVYIAPLPGEITEVEYRGPDPGGYFDAVQRWSVRLRVDAGFEIRFDHLARIAPALRDLVRAATGVDTDTYAGATGDVLGGARLRVSAGTELARPQVFATEVRPGLFRGGGSFGDRPWAQMEFFISEAGERCAFALLPADRAATIQGVLDREMADPAAQRYSAYQPLRWTWSAEGLLCLDSPPLGRLFDGRGGWFERPGPGSVAADELFSIVPIARESHSWNPALYSSPKVDALVLRRKLASAGAFSWLLPDGTTARPFYPNGEVLERTDSGLLIRWRDVGPAEIFQRAAYRFAGGVLKVRWGAFATSAASAAAPALTDSTPCDGVDVVCYDQVGRPGF